MMSNVTRVLPAVIRQRYEVHEWRNALAVLSVAHPEELKEIIAVLGSFHLLKDDILKKGGNKSPVARKLDSHFYRLGWEERAFDTSIQVDKEVFSSPTHSVDCFKMAVAIEVEWNNKDTFFDRDLNNFRLLFDLRAVEVGIIITRCDELQSIFNELGKGSSYGVTTTHMSQLLPRIEGGGGGGCPIVVFGIGRKLYVQH